MKSNKESKVIKVIGIDGKVSKRTIFKFKGAKVSTNCCNGNTSTAKNAFKSYLKNN